MTARKCVLVILPPLSRRRYAHDVPPNWSAPEPASQRCLAGGQVRRCRGAGVYGVLVLGADAAGDVFERRQRHTVSLAHVAEDVLHEARIAGTRPTFAELGDERRPQGGMERGCWWDRADMTFLLSMMALQPMLRGCPERDPARMRGIPSQTVRRADAGAVSRMEGKS